MADTNVDNSENSNLDDLSKHLIKCYQIQINEYENNNDDTIKAQPIWIGNFSQIPVKVYDTFTYSNGELKTKGNIIKINDIAKTDNIVNSIDFNNDNMENEINESKYIINVVGYVISQEMIDNNVMPIVGIVVSENNGSEELTPMCTLDLMYNKETNMFEYLYINKKEDESQTKQIDDIIKKEDIFKNIVLMILEEPIISVIS